MKQEILNRLVNTLPRHLLLDLTDAVVARAREAHELIRTGTRLTGKSARGAEGQVRFRTMEQSFQEVCETFGGTLLSGPIVEGSDLRIFQPFMRFGSHDSVGVVLGLASMPASREMPVKNMSRAAGVMLNYHVTGRLALDERDPKPGDVFVLFLVARDPARSGQIAEIAIGIIDADYKSYVFYESIETFMARYAPADKPVQNAEEIIKPRIRLKAKPAAFIPPEAEGQDNNSGIQNT